MTITTTASETYEQRLDPAVELESPVEPVSASHSSLPVPKLLWAGISLFAINMAVLGGIALSPELRVSVYGADLPGYRVSVDKPSPFTEVVDPVKPRKVKLAQHMTPVVYQPEPMMEDVSQSPTELAIPRASQVAAASAIFTAPSSNTMARELVPPTPRRVTN